MKLTHLLGLAAIVLLGAFLRLYQLDVMKFGDDEATHLHLAVNWLEEGSFPLVGLPTSMGINRPAGFTYLLAAPSLFGRHPLVATAFVAFLHILSIVLAYRIVRTYFGRRAATLASLLYASSFWATYAARHLWDSSLEAPVALLVVDRLLAAAVQRRASALGWALFWASAGIAIHPSGVALMGVTVAVALALRVPIRPTRLAFPLLLAMLLWVPFLSHLVLGRGSDLFAAGQILGRPPSIDLLATKTALWQLFPHPEDPLFQATQGSIVPGSPWLPWLQPAIAAAFLASLAWCAVRGLPSLRRPDHPGNRYLVVVLAYIVPLVVFLRHSFPVYNHYVFQLLPFSAVVLALGLLASIRALRRVLIRLHWTGDTGPGTGGRAFRWALAAAIALAVGQSWFLFAYVRWLSAHGTTFSSGVPFRSFHDALQAASALRTSASNPIHIASRPESALTYEYLASPVVVVDQERSLVFSSFDGPLVYMTVADNSRAGSLLRQQFPESERFHLFRTYAVMMGMGEGGSAISTSFPDPQQIPTLRASPPDYYRVYLLPPGAGRLAQEASTRTRGTWSLRNGIRLEGYTLPQEILPSQDVLLTLAWTVVEPPPDPAHDYRFFVHLLDRAGQKWGEANELDYGAARWRAGDRVVSWLPVPVPDGAPQGLYSLHFGMFDAESQEPVEVTDAGVPGAPLVAGPVRLIPGRPPAAPAHPLEPPARFGEGLELVGWDLPLSAKEGDAVLALRLLWRTTRTLTTDYTLFVHLLDEQGRLVAQADGFPAGGLYPTSAWRPGELVEDRRRLPLPASAAGQQLSIALGWYRLATGQRLTLEGSTESTLSLGPVQALP